MKTSANTTSCFSSSWFPWRFGRPDIQRQRFVRTEEARHRDPGFTYLPLSCATQAVVFQSFLFNFRIGLVLPRRFPTRSLTRPWQAFLSWRTKSWFRPEHAFDISRLIRQVSPVHSLRNLFPFLASCKTHQFLFGECFPAKTFRSR